MWSAVRQRDDVLHAQASRVDATVGAPIPEGCFDGVPLRLREVVHGCGGEPGQPSLLGQSALFRMGSVVLPSLGSFLFEPFRILTTAAMRFLMHDANSVGVRLGV